MYPQFNYAKNKTLDQSVFSKLQVRYLIAITAIAVAIVISQILVQEYLDKQLNDSRVINLAGRQRMLSQKISKEAIKLTFTNDVNEREIILNELQQSVDLWTRSYKGLVHGDSSLKLDGNISQTVYHMFDTIDVFYTNIVQAVDSIKANAEDKKEFSTYIHQILINEPAFLAGMDRIVFQLDEEANNKVLRLKRLEYILVIVALSILFFEVIFIFRPIAQYIRQIIASLVKSEREEKEKGKVNLQKKGEEQKLRSNLIFEGQERERRRMARDLHDGIGQLLTGLKFQIESIDIKNEAVADKTLIEVKSQTANIIKEIRRISFNLRPSVLSDYGLPSVLKNMVQEMNKYTETEISFTNLTNFNIRLHKKLETQLYRLVQEAVTNALKHAHAKTIQIKLWHKSYFVAISILDDGIGFDVKEAMSIDLKSRLGHGLTNMHERANFIDAEFNIKSSTGKGSEVSINLPLE